MSNCQTPDTEQDALDRAGGSLGNKGTEAAEAAIKMVDFKRKVQDLSDDYASY